jgi:PAS domain S-box-containing protein
MTAKPSYSDLEAKVKDLEREIAGQQSIEKLLWMKQDQLFKVLDSLEAIVYVADMHSYEILFANRYAERLFGHITGKTCWQVLQSGMSGPCPFCRNKDIVTPGGKPRDTILWEQQNTINDQWYTVRDRAIDWFDGRVVHLQIAVDITDRKKAEAELQASEEKFRTVADFTYDWEYWLSENGTFNYISPSCERITGYSVEEFEKDTDLICSIVHQDDRQVFTKHFKQELDIRKVFHLNYRIITKTGEERWISHYCQPVYGRDGKFLGRRASNRDISEQKKYESKIKLNELRLATLLDLYEKQGMPVKEICDFVLEASLPLTGSSIGFLGFIGDDESLMTIHAWSKSVMGHCKTHEKPLVFNILEAGLWGEAIRRRHPVIINDYGSSTEKRGIPAGHLNIIRFLAVPLFAGEKIVAMAAVGNKAQDYDENDIVQLQLLMEGMWLMIKRRESEDELVSHAEMIKHFAYSVSHDLKNPAVAIHGLAKVLQKKYEDMPREKRESFIEQITRGSEQIITLSEDINAFIASRETTLHIKVLDLKEIWQTIREEFVSRLKKKKVLWIESGGDIPEIKADRNGLLRIYRNLVDNALKYGGRDLSEISLDYSASETSHILSVQNNGKVIPLEETEAIFEVFRRKASEAESGGSGLGLAIVREIAKNHKGNSWVESGVDGKTTFYVSIARNL